MDKTGSGYTVNSMESIANNYNVAEKETLKAYGVSMFKDIFPKSTEVSPYGAAWQTTIPTGSDMEIVFKKARRLLSIKRSQSSFSITREI